jgi:peptide/nickel transport system substrate-binding protein
MMEHFRYGGNETGNHPRHSRPRYHGVRMDNRFTFKDFIFTVLFIGLIAAVLLAMWQFSWQEHRLNGLQDQLKVMNSFQKQQLATLEDLRDELRKGVRLGPTTSNGTASTQVENEGIIDRKTDDGGHYVYYPQAPKTPFDPHGLKNYSTGDWLVQNLGSEPSIITPFLEKDAYGADVQGPILENLLTRNPETFKWEPFLAESYTVSADGLTYTFVLRKGLTFSDGHPLTADDVLFSYNTVASPKIDSGRYKAYYGDKGVIQSCEKKDDRTIVFTLKRPYFQGLENCGTLPILPEHIYKWKNPDDYNNRNALLVGSGPYVFKEWQTGQQIVLTRNEHYWGERPTYDRIVFRFITNPQAAFQSFMNQQIDLFAPLPDQYEKFSVDKDFTSKFKTFLLKVPNAGYRYIGWNLTKPMFADKLTRQALTELIDRQALIDTIQKKQAIPITGPFSPMTPQYDTTVKAWPYDVEDAKKKLAAAGWKLDSDNHLTRDGQLFKFDLMIPSQSPPYQQTAEYVKQQFKKAGIDVVISPFEFSVLVDRLDNRNFDAAMLGWTGSIEGDPYQIWHSDSIKDKGSNFISFNNKEADTLIEEGRRTLDEAKRMEIWHKLHQLIHEEQPYTFLAMAMDREFVNGRFENTRPYKTGLNPFDWFVPLDRQKYH